MNYEWGSDPADQSTIVILDRGREVMKISVYEVMEMAGRSVVLPHVQRCELGPKTNHWWRR